jgi:hypothetical protein
MLSFCETFKERKYFGLRPCSHNYGMIEVVAKMDCSPNPKDY